MRRLSSLKTSPVRAIQVAALVMYLLATASALRAGQAPAGAGRSVWDGVFTAEQASRGRIMFSANCASCHGGNLGGGEGKPLIGDPFWTDWRETTVGDLTTYISKNMPFSEDGSLAGTLSANTYVDIVAHILGANGLPAGTQELTVSSGVGVRIISKDGPGELPGSTLARVVGCLAPRGTDGSWRLVKATRATRASDTAAAPDRDVPLGEREYQLKFVLSPLTNFVGHRLSVTGLLLGDGGVDGLNVSTVRSVAASCT